MLRLKKYFKEKNYKPKVFYDNLVTGLSGSGKTTISKNYLKNINLKLKI